jgi:hypothetical protein
MLELTTHGSLVPALWARLTTESASTPDDVRSTSRFALRPAASMSRSAAGQRRGAVPSTSTSSVRARPSAARAEPTSCTLPAAAHVGSDKRQLLFDDGDGTRWAVRDSRVQITVCGLTRSALMVDG